MNSIKDNNSPYIKFFFTKNEQLPEFMSQYKKGVIIVVEKYDSNLGKNYYELYRDNKLISSGYGFHDPSLIGQLTKIAADYYIKEQATKDKIKDIEGYLKTELENYVKRKSKLETEYITVSGKNGNVDLHIEDILNNKYPVFEDILITDAKYVITYTRNNTNTPDKTIKRPLTVTNGRPVLTDIVVDIPIGHYISNINCIFSYKKNDSDGLDLSGTTKASYSKYVHVISGGEHTIEKKKVPITYATDDITNVDTTATNKVTLNIALNNDTPSVIFPSITKQTVFSDLTLNVRYAAPKNKKILYDLTYEGNNIQIPVNNSFYEREKQSIKFPSVSIKPKFYFIHFQTGNNSILSELLSNITELGSVRQNTVEFDYIPYNSHCILLPYNMKISEGYIINKDTGYKESISSCVSYEQTDTGKQSVISMPWIPFTTDDQRLLMDMNKYIISGLDNTKLDGAYKFSFIIDVEDDSKIFNSIHDILTTESIKDVLDNTNKKFTSIVDEQHEQLYWRSVDDLSQIPLYINKTNG